MISNVLTGYGHGFVIHHSQGILHARKVILATGGRSIPKSGSDGFGYSLARRLGHHVTATVPALVAAGARWIRCFTRHFPVSPIDVKLTTIIKRRHVDSRTGGLLWTHFGVSGPVVMDASRFWCLAQEQEETVAVYGSFLPDQTSGTGAAMVHGPSGRHSSTLPSRRRSDS